MFLGVWNITSVAAKKLKDVSHEDEFKKEISLLVYVILLSFTDGL